MKFINHSFITLLILCLSVGAYAQSGFLSASSFSATELAAANTAAPALYLSSTEKEMIQYLNLARLYPEKFAKVYLAHLKKNDPSGYAKFKKRDKYYYGLYKDLLATSKKNLQALQPSAKMFHLAKCWAKESGTKGLTGHDRQDCKGGHFAECCSYAWNKNPMKHILQLLVDENVASLGHRKIMLSNYKSVGISMQPHKRYSYCSVLDFSGTGSALAKN